MLKYILPLILTFPVIGQETVALSTIKQENGVIFGQVFIKVIPPGASIFIKGEAKVKNSDFPKSALPTNDDLVCLGAANSLIKVPMGDQELIVSLRNYRDYNLKINVHTDHIIKPDPITLIPLTRRINIVFDEEWPVFINDIRVMDIENKEATTPCSILIPSETKTITLKKEGYKDIVEEITGKSDITINKKPEKTEKTIEIKKNFNFNKFMDELTEEKWNNLKGIELQIPASKPLNTNILINEKDSYKIAIIPHPTDKWQWGFKNNKIYDSNWKGTESPWGHFGWLGYYLSSQNETKNCIIEKCGIIEGNGRLNVIMYDTDYKNNIGSIRIKLLKIN